MRRRSSCRSWWCACWAASIEARGDVDGRVLDLFAGQLPGWLSGVATIAFIVGGLYVVGLMVGILVLGRGRSAVARDMLLAAALGFAACVAAAYLFGPEFPDLLPELAEREGFPSFPVPRLTIAVAAIRVAGPYSRFRCAGSVTASSLRCRSLRSC